MKGQRPLHQQLGFRPRNEHGRTHAEVDRPELPVPQDVGHGLPGAAALDELEKPSSGIGRSSPLGVRAQPGSAGAESMGEEQLGIESGRGVRIMSGLRRQTLRTSREQCSDRRGLVLDSRRSHREAKMPPMPNALYPPLKPRSFGELLDAVLQIFRLSLLKCLPYATVAIIAGQLSTLYYLSRGRMPVLDSNDPVGVTLYGLGTLIAVILWTAMLLRQSAIASGRPVAGSIDLLDTLKRVPAIAAIALLAGAAVAVFMVPPLALAPPYRNAGIALMLAPAIYITVALSFSLPALVLTRKGILGSLAYSFRLVRGNWWRVATIYVVGIAVIWTLCVLVATIATMALSDNGADDAAVTRAVTSAAVLAVAAIGLTFYSALTLALFGDLQIRKSASG